MALADYCPREVWRGDDSSRRDLREVPEQQGDFAGCRRSADAAVSNAEREAEPMLTVSQDRAPPLLRNHVGIAAGRAGRRNHRRRTGSGAGRIVSMTSPRAL